MIPNEDVGRSPAEAGSGSRPTDGAASVSTADAASIPNAEGWEWWSGPDDEFYRCGPCSSRDDAVEEALRDYDDCSHIYVIEALPAKWPPPCATTIIEYMYENSDDLFYEDFPDPCGTPEENREAEAELQAALNAWMNKWRDVIFPRPTTFARMRNAETVPTASAIEAAAADETRSGSAEGESAAPRSGETPQ